MENKRKTIDNFKSVLFAGFISVLISVVMAMLLSLLIINGTLKKESINIYSVIITTIAVVAGCIIVVKKKKENALLYATGTAAVYFAITLFAKLTCFPESANNLPRNGLICLGASLLGAILGTKRKNKSKKIRHARGR